METGEYRVNKVWLYRGNSLNGEEDSEIWEDFLTDYEGKDGEVVSGVIVGNSFIVLEKEEKNDRRKKK